MEMLAGGDGGGSEELKMLPGDNSRCLELCFLRMQVELFFICKHAQTGI